MPEYDQIPVHEGTKEALYNEKRHDETWDDVVQRATEALKRGDGGE